MTWLEKKKNWTIEGGRLKKPPARGAKKKMVARMYSVSEVAELLSVSRRTVFKWLALDDPENAVIPPDAWIKLPSGYIRIKEAAVLELQGQG
jgi:hypothetical protein